MPWTPEQRNRLAIEKEILEKYFPGKVVWIDPTSDTKVEVTMTTNGDKVYVLRVYVPKDFPNSLPTMVVRSSPKPMPNWGSDGATHTLGHTSDGYLRICHYHWSRWDAQHTFYEIFVKGRLWLEAYDGHLDTKKRMDYYLGHMQGR